MKEESEKYLKDYESEMITSLFFNYSRPIPTQNLKEIWGILSDEGKDPGNINYGCSGCILKLMRMAARFYFKTFPDRIPEKYRDRKI